MLELHEDMVNDLKIFNAYKYLWATTLGLEILPTKELLWETILKYELAIELNDFDNNIALHYNTVNTLLKGLKIWV